MLAVVGSALLAKPEGWTYLRYFCFRMNFHLTVDHSVHQALLLIVITVVVCCSNRCCITSQIINFEIFSSAAAWS